MQVTTVKCDICGKSTVDPSDWYRAMQDEQNFAVTSNRQTMRDGFRADICPDCVRSALQKWLAA